MWEAECGESGSDLQVRVVVLFFSLSLSSFWVHPHVLRPFILFLSFVLVTWIAADNRYVYSQCARRNFVCEYPESSRRGHHSRRVLLQEPDAPGPSSSLFSVDRQ